MEAAMNDVEAATEIRPFHVDVPEEELGELRRRVAATRWPEEETVEGQSQGVPLVTMQQLIRYWGSEYDFGRLKARLKAVPHFVTEIDGLDIHFIHVKSPEEDALPLIITHGWPGSFIEMLNVIGPLSGSAAHGGDADDAFDVRFLDPWLRLLGEAVDHRLGPGSHRARVVRADEAPRLHALCRAGRRLGRADHRRDGPGGTTGAGRHPLEHAGDGPAGGVEGARDRRRRAGRALPRGAARLGPAEVRLHEGDRLRGRDEPAPANAVRARRLARRPRGLDARPRRQEPRGHRAGVRGTSHRQPQPRQSARQHHDFNEVAEGNHFAAWQEPEIFTNELRTAFRTLH
jgi:hypothetical protein